MTYDNNELTWTRRQFFAAAGAAAGMPILGAAGSALAAGRPRYPDVIGSVTYYVTQKDDTLLDLARWNGLGYTEMIAANRGIDPWVPGVGVKLTIPGAHILPAAPREGVVLNLADQRLYVFFAEDGSVDSAPIGIGKSAWGTPTGRTKVVRKRANPTWYVPKSIRAEDPDLPAVVRPGPLNPLGNHAIYLDWPSYLLHGTNEPYGVGRRVSHGCVRLYPEDISRLFTQLPIGLPVTVVNQEVKFAWVGGTLMMEAHPSQEQADQLEADGTFARARPAQYEYRILDAAGAHAARLDWRTVARALDERTGMPVTILTIKRQSGTSRPNSAKSGPAPSDSES